MKSHSPQHPGHHSPHRHSTPASPNDDFLQTYRLGGPNRYSAENMAKPMHFVCRMPHAREVFLAGDFNGWNEKAHPMKRQPDGAWRLGMLLNHGHHHYLLVADGTDQDVRFNPRPEVLPDRAQPQAALEGFEDAFDFSQLQVALGPARTLLGRAPGV